VISGLITNATTTRSSTISASLVTANWAFSRRKINETMERLRPEIVNEGQSNGGAAEAAP
jgi:hypothetical protein